MPILLSIVTDAVKDHSYNWIFAAASLPPLLYLVAKKKKMVWLQKLIYRKGKKNWLHRWFLTRKLKRSKGDKTPWWVYLLGAGLAVGLTFLFVALLGGWAKALAAIVVVGLIAMAYGG